MLQVSILRLEPTVRFELTTPSLPWKCSTPELRRQMVIFQKEKITVVTLLLGAEDEARTRDPQLGRLMLYQLSYFCVGKNSDFRDQISGEPEY